LLLRDIILGLEAKYLAEMEIEPPLNPGESSQTSVPKLPNDKTIVKGEALDGLVQKEVTKQLAVIRKEMTEKFKKIRSTKRRWIEKVS